MNSTSSTSSSADRQGSGDYALSVRAVSKRFGTRTVLDAVSFEVPKGSVTALVGRSGSGKSTLLHTICGLTVPDSGSIRVGGAEIAGADSEFATEARLRHIGIVFQFFHLLPTLTLRENIMLPGRLLRMGENTATRRVEELAAAVRIGHVLQSFPDEVSGGELQRAAIARALFNNPSIVIADEPTGNLDHTTAREVLTLFQQLRNDLQITLLIATHDPEVIQGVDQVLHLDDGRIAKHTQARA